MTTTHVHQCAGVRLRHHMLSTGRIMTIVTTSEKNYLLLRNKKKDTGVNVHEYIIHVYINISHCGIHLVTMCILCIQWQRIVYYVCCYKMLKQA